MSTFEYKGRKVRITERKTGFFASVDGSPFVFAGIHRQMPNEFVARQKIKNVIDAEEAK